MRFTRTLLEFETQFPAEADCWAYLRRARWPAPSVFGWKRSRRRARRSNVLQPSVSDADERNTSAPIPSRIR